MSLKTFQPPGPERSALELIIDIGLEVLLIIFFVAGNALVEYATTSWWLKGCVQVLDVVVLWKMAIVPAINNSVPVLCATLIAAGFNLIEFIKAIRRLRQLPQRPKTGSERKNSEVRRAKPALVIKAGDKNKQG